MERVESYEHHITYDATASHRDAMSQHSLSLTVDVINKQFHPS